MFGFGGRARDRTQEVGGSSPPSSTSWIARRRGRFVFSRPPEGAVPCGLGSRHRVSSPGCGSPPGSVGAALVSWLISHRHESTIIDEAERGVLEYENAELLSGLEICLEALR